MAAAAETNLVVSEVVQITLRGIPESWDDAILKIVGLKDRLESVDISECQIDVIMGHKLGKVLEGAPMLKSLRLFNCGLDADAATFLLPLLPSLPVLRDLDISYNLLDREYMIKLYDLCPQLPTIAGIDTAGNPVGRPKSHVKSHAKNASFRNSPFLLNQNRQRRRFGPRLETVWEIWCASRPDVPCTAEIKKKQMDEWLTYFNMYPSLISVPPEKFLEESGRLRAEHLERIGQRIRERKEARAAERAAKAPIVLNQNQIFVEGPDKELIPLHQFHNNDSGAPDKTQK